MGITIFGAANEIAIAELTEAGPVKMHLAIACSECKGLGCDDCANTGLYITESGRAIIELMKIHSRMEQARGRGND